MTFSILARDAKTWDLWVWVCTHWFGSWSLVCWGKSWVGVVATQANTNTSYWPLWLSLLTEWYSSKTAIEKLVQQDLQRETRQLAILASSGDFAQFSGKECISEVCTYHWDGFCVQANMMSNSLIAEIVGSYFASHPHLELAERILWALDAGQAGWWDIRWMQSAGLMIVSGTPKPEWEDKIYHLCVDDAPNPLFELRRLLGLKKVYMLLGEADELSAIWKYEECLNLFEKAQNLAPENEEIIFWKGLTLIHSWKKKEGTELIEKLSSQWRLLLGKII